jgi:hypothetical protein
MLTNAVKQQENNMCIKPMFLTANIDVQLHFIRRCYVCQIENKKKKTQQQQNPTP